MRKSSREELKEFRGHLLGRGGERLCWGSWLLLVGLIVWSAGVWWIPPHFMTLDLVLTIVGAAVYFRGPGAAFKK